MLPGFMVPFFLWFETVGVVSRFSPLVIMNFWRLLQTKNDGPVESTVHSGDAIPIWRLKICSRVWYWIDVLKSKSWKIHHQGTCKWNRKNPACLVIKGPGPALESRLARRVARKPRRVTQHTSHGSQLPLEGADPSVTSWRGYPKWIKQSPTFFGGGNVT